MIYSEKELTEFLSDLELDGSREVFLDDRDLAMLKEIKEIVIAWFHSG